MKLVVPLVVGVVLFAIVRDGRSQSPPQPVSGKAVAGPALAGEAVVWGEEYADGSLAVVRRAAGTAPEVVHRIAAPDDENGDRSFYGLPGAVSASERWIGYAMDDAIWESDGGDSVSSELRGRAYGSLDGGEFRSLLPCGDAAYVSTAADGDALAIGLDGATCNGRDGTWVWLVEGTEQPKAVYLHEGFLALRQVQVAGPYVAWSEGGSGGGDVRIRVARRSDGEQIAVLRPSDFGGRRTFEAFDIDARGNVAALTGRCDYTCLHIRNVNNGGRPRTLARNAGGRVAVDGGRVAYVAGNRVVVRTLKGRLKRSFGRFTRTRQPRGELALAGGRLAWSVLSGARPPEAENPKVRGRVRVERIR
jgi:hypothetical protein